MHIPIGISPCVSIVSRSAREQMSWSTKICHIYRDTNLQFLIPVLFLQHSFSPYISIVFNKIH